MNDSSLAVSLFHNFLSIPYQYNRHSTSKQFVARAVFRETVFLSAAILKT